MEFTPRGIGEKETSGIREEKDACERMKLRAGATPTYPISVAVHDWGRYITYTSLVASVSRRFS